MSPHVESFILPFLFKLGRGVVLTTTLVADLLGYKRRRVYDFFRELEIAGWLTRKPGGHVWWLA